MERRKPTRADAFPERLYKGRSIQSTMYRPTISRDGMLEGPSIELYKQILAEFPDMHLIASGGVSCIEDIIQLEIAKVPAVVFGKALYEGKITLKELNRFM